MKIRSKFKDYYDYIGHRYGEDPDVTYVRGKVPGAGEIKDEKILKGLGLGWRYCRTMRKDTENSAEYDIEYLVAGEMIFPLVRCVKYICDSGPFVTYQPLDSKMLYWISGSQQWPTEEKLWEKYQTDISSPTFLSSIRELMLRAGVPVFHIGWGNMFHLEIAQNTPILKNFWIPSIVKPEVMWQSIYSTMTTIFRKNVDKEPPVEIGNEDKIVKAGFDLKTSFRNPVNQRPKKKRRTRRGSKEKV